MTAAGRGRGANRDDHVSKVHVDLRFLIICERLNRTDGIFLHVRCKKYKRKRKQDGHEEYIKSRFEQAEGIHRETCAASLQDLEQVQ